MKVLATELQMGYRVKRDGYTYQILSVPKKVDFQLRKSEKEVCYDVRYIDFNSTRGNYKGILSVKNEIKEGKYDDTTLVFRKTTMVKVY